jgi:hypothetical protein
MHQKNPAEIKEKIIQILANRGPMLPVYISKEINLESIFTSAFLSELVSEKRIRISNMRVGSSPIYFIEEKTPEIEKFGLYLKSKEKEAFLLLKEKKFLDDEKLEPAIKVAIREIKDFAIPFENEGKLIWRYFTVQESNFKEQKDKLPVEIKSVEIKEINSQQELKKKERVKKVRKTLKTKTNKFFEKVKEFLSNKNIEIKTIEKIGTKELIVKVKENEEEKLLIYFDKKKISEQDIIKANIKANELKLKYILLTLTEPPKKMINYIDALKNLSEIRSLK